MFITNLKTIAKLIWFVCTVTDRNLNQFPDKARARTRTQDETERRRGEETSEGHQRAARAGPQDVRGAAQAGVQGQQGALEEGAQHGRGYTQTTTGRYATVSVLGGNWSQAGTFILTLHKLNVNNWSP